MFDHVVVRVRDLERSKAFYATVLAPLGLEESEGPETFHRAGVEAGYPDNGAPGLREYAPD